MGAISLARASTHYPSKERGEGRDLTRIFGVLRQSEKLSEIKPPLKLKQDGIIALIACATIELDYTCHYCNAGSLVYS
jgi:hypothetical protein